MATAGSPRKRRYEKPRKAPHAFVSGGLGPAECRACWSWRTVAFMPPGDQTGGFRILAIPKRFCILGSILEANQLQSANSLDTLRLAVEAR
jgi:hypothetical protein